MKNDIRFLVTNACNYDCYFCHMEGVNSVTRKHRLLIDDYIILFKLYFSMEKWNGVTISGGEPLLFRNIDILLKRLFEEKANITLVTNGSLLHLHLKSMKYVKRVNVSIHTMNQDMYSQIVNREAEKLSVVKENLKHIRNKLHSEEDISQYYNFYEKLEINIKYVLEKLKLDYREFDTMKPLEITMKEIINYIKTF